MLPRRPTRLELTQDDMQEYERMKAERKAYEEELLAAAVQQGTTRVDSKIRAIAVVQQQARQALADSKKAGSKQPARKVPRLHDWTHQRLDHHGVRLFRREPHRTMVANG